MNKYVIPNLPNTDPRVTRVIQDLADRVNYLQLELENVRKIAADVKGLAKAANPLSGILTIPGFENDGFVRVNSDGVVSSYGSPTPLTYDVSLMGTFYTDTAVHQTPASTTETTLSSVTIPTNTLANDGDYLLVISRMVYGANANGKRYKLYFGANLMYDTGVITPNGLSQLFFGIVYREISTTVSACSTNLLTNLAAGSNVATTFASPVSFAVDNILRTTGQNSVATAGDIVQAGFFVIKGSAGS